MGKKEVRQRPWMTKIHGYQRMDWSKLLEKKRGSELGKR